MANGLHPVQRRLLSNSKIHAAALALACLTLPLCLSACNKPILKYNMDGPAMVLTPLGSPPVQDGRARFQAIFCEQIVAHQGDDAPDDFDCAKYLHAFSDDPGPDSNENAQVPLDRFRVFIVPVGDANAMAKAMLSLLEDPQRRLRMAAAGKVSAGRFSVEVALPRYVAAITGAANNPERKPSDVRRKHMA